MALGVPQEAVLELLPGSQSSSCGITQGVRMRWKQPDAKYFVIQVAAEPAEVGGKPPPDAGGLSGLPQAQKLANLHEN